MRIRALFPDINIPAEEADFFHNAVSQMSMAKGDYFVASDAICNKIAFIESGRLHSIIRKGSKEYVIAVHSKDQFVSAFTSFFTQENSHWSIQALEPTHLTVISNPLLGQLCQQHICWLQFWIRVLGNKTLDMIETERHLLRDIHSA